MTLRSPDFSAVRRIFAIRNFAVYTAGNAVSLIGIWVQRTTVGWLTWELTHSGAWLGAVAMAELLPVFFLAPLTGALADRLDRRRIAVTGQAFATLQAAVLAALTISGNITAAMVFALQLLSGMIQPMIQTARLVLVPSLVPKENVNNAVAITSLMFNVARIIGPGVAGVIITIMGAGFSFALNAITYLGVIAVLVSLDLPPHQPKTRGGAGPGVLSSLWTDMIDGWRYTLAHPRLGWLMLLMSVVSMLCWPLGDLLAGIVDAIYNRGAEGLAILSSAGGLGAVIGGVFLAQRKGTEGLGRIVLTCAAVQGALMAIFAEMDVFWLAAGILVVNGMFAVVAGVGSQTLTQTSVEDHMRGRALSVWFTITRVGPAIGALGLGSLASIFGFAHPLFFAGITTAAVAAVLMLRQKGRPASGV